MSDWLSADRAAHAKIVSVALLASAIFVVIGLTAQSDNAATRPGHNDGHGNRAHLPRSVDAILAPIANAPARPDRSAAFHVPNT